MSKCIRARKFGIRCRGVRTLGKIRAKFSEVTSKGVWMNPSWAFSEDTLAEW